MKKTMLFTMILALILSLTACASDMGNKTATTDIAFAQQLFESRNPYVGDNSADLEILTLLNISEDLGDYTIELQTSAEPYSLKLNFQDPVMDKDAFDLQMQNNACLILALIENAGEVHWSYPAQENSEAGEITGSVSAVEISTRLDKDIKKFGETPEQMQELLNLLNLSN